MKKSKIIYTCQKCGFQSPKWLGRCTECGEWGSFIEETVSPGIPQPDRTLGGLKPQPITEITPNAAIRLPSGLNEVDRILGGGIVLGSVILIGGDPGIGKSTLLLQVSNRISHTGLKVLYVSAEESVYQTKLRAERLGRLSENLLVVSEPNLALIGSYIEEYVPSFVVIDSIQMVYKPELATAPGTITQLRECSLGLVYLAKRKGIPMVLIGHVTKEGAIAGPRSLEHLVDTVLYFEGERFQTFRLLRAVKNRFGATNEVALFEMKQEGLCEVTNPSEFLIAQRSKQSAGSALISALVGTRTLLVEIEALTAHSYYSMPTRRVRGIDYNRLMMLMAVLERRVGLHLGGQDIFVNAVGGVEIEEPAADLGIACAIASALKNKPVNPESVWIGEIGLSGEVRGVQQINNRLQEVVRLGLKQAIIPKSNMKGLDKPPGIEIVPVDSLQQVIDLS